MTIVDIQIIAQRHLPDGYGHCEECPQPWPCDAAQLLDHIHYMIHDLQEAHSKLAVVVQNAFRLAGSYDGSPKRAAAQAEGPFRESD